MDHLSGSAFGKITIEKGQMVAAIFPQDKWSVPTGNVIVARLHLTSNSLTHTQREPDICTHTRARARTHAHTHVHTHLRMQVEHTQPDSVAWEVFSHMFCV